MKKNSKFFSGPPTYGLNQRATRKSASNHLQFSESVQKGKIIGQNFVQRFKKFWGKISTLIWGWGSNIDFYKYPT